MILSWDKPEQIMSPEAWKGISADGAPPGVYVPNMSEVDCKKWKAKLIKGKHPRVEIRKSTHCSGKSLNPKFPWGGGCSAEILIIVGLKGVKHRQTLHDCNIKMSQNGASSFSFDEFQQLQQAVKEARAVLQAL